jgi:hypothetical protein
MPEREFSRRDLLKAGGLIAATSVAGGLIFAENAQAQHFSPDALSKPLPPYGKEITLHEAGKEIELAPKRLIPVGKDHGIPPNDKHPEIGQIYVPNCIVIHTTDAPWTTATEIYDFFAHYQKGQPAKDDQGNPITVGVAAHFGIGKKGDTLQMTRLYEEGVYRAYAVHDYPANLSMELNYKGKYGYKDRSAAPEAQFERAVDLTMKLMEQYDIPLGEREYDWQARKNGKLYDDAVPIPPGVYGHYQLNPLSRHDPGIGLLRDVRSEIKHRLAK